MSDADHILACICRGREVCISRNKKGFAIHVIEGDEKTLIDEARSLDPDFIDHAIQQARLFDIPLCLPNGVRITARTPALAAFMVATLLSEAEKATVQ